MTTDLLMIFGQQFPKYFHDHVEHLRLDAEFRAEWQAQVRGLPLEVWYSSPIWKQTARLIKMRTMRCERDGGLSDYFDVHHRHYDYLGIEVLHPESLLVVCRECHKELTKMRRNHYLPCMEGAMILPGANSVLPGIDGSFFR